MFLTHSPRKGMETLAKLFLARFWRFLTHSPRKGMETLPASPPRGAGEGFLTHSPRKGMETLEVFDYEETIFCF